MFHGLFKTFDSPPSRPPYWALCVPDGCNTGDVNITVNSILMGSLGTENHVRIKFPEFLCQALDDVEYLIMLTNPSETSEYLKERVDDISSKLIINGTLAVDTFFTISGLLLSYNFMTTRHEKIGFSVFDHYVHRYLRLTVPYALTMLVVAAVTPYLAEGPLWPLLVKSFQSSCQQNWWSCLLYIQNYIDANKICLPQAWYLMADMQLFLTSPMVLFGLWKFTKIAIVLLGWCCLVSALIGFYTIWRDKLPAVMHRNYFSDHKGIITGYLIFKVKRERRYLVIKRKYLLCFWLLYTGMLVACVFGSPRDLPDQEYNAFYDGFYAAFAKPAWVFAIAWIISACATNNAGPVNRILSSTIFEVLNKFTYSMFLSHVTVLSFSLNRYILRYFTIFNLFYELWGTVAYSALISVFLVFAVEAPVTTLLVVLSPFKTAVRAIVKVNALIIYIVFKCITGILYSTASKPDGFIHHSSTNLATEHRYYE
ncbi:nose resistant to fluoxetine protein 6-like [Zophobas morio]|uniref:nose resistant to fluoxetine protein 6-like n=1 Tax=Zophobas morio TaxID=2755281 RepID=UPI0030827827